MCSLRQANAQANALFNGMFIILAVVILAGVVFFGEQATTSELLFSLFLLCGCLTFPIYSLTKE